MHFTMITPTLQRSTGVPCPVPSKISGATYPGVPQAVVNTWLWSFKSLERPKSVINNSESSSGVLNNS